MLDYTSSAKSTRWRTYAFRGGVVLAIIAAVTAWRTDPLIRESKFKGPCFYLPLLGGPWLVTLSELLFWTISRQSLVAITRFQPNEAREVWKQLFADSSRLRRGVAAAICILLVAVNVVLGYLMFGILPLFFLVIA